MFKRYGQYLIDVEAGSVVRHRGTADTVSSLTMSLCGGPVAQIDDNAIATAIFAEWSEGLDDLAAPKVEEPAEDVAAEEPHKKGRGHKKADD